MRRSLALALGLSLAAPVAAAGAHLPWIDPGEMPMSFAYSKTGPDAGIRTGVVITGGGGPAVQRVAYGTADGIVHLQTLDRGSPVTVGEGDPELGIDIDDGPVNDTSVFGQGNGTIAPLDTSTEDRLGHLLALHNDNGAVHLAQVDLQTGQVIGPQAIAQSLGCAANATPALTPADAAGDRFIFFTMTGGACRRAGLLRARIAKAATREAAVQPDELIPISDLVATASPAVVYLNDASGSARPLVAVAAAGRLALYPATAPVEGLQPAFTVALPAGETPQTPVTPYTGPGLPPGAPGSGATKTPAIYLSTQTATGETRVHRFVQRGNEQALTLAGSSPALAGAPAPSITVGELAENATTRPGGRIAVSTAAAVHLLDAGALSVVTSLAASPGFSRTGAVISGDYVYVPRDNGEPIVLRASDGARVPVEQFAPNAEHVAGDAFGAPAVSRGYVAWGGAPGVFVYRNRDVTAPFAALGAPGDAAVLAGPVTFTATAGDTRGVKQVDFRLRAGSAQPKVVARDTEPDQGSPFMDGGATYSAVVQAGGLANGVYVADVVVTDSSGNSTVSGARTIRVIGSGKQRIDPGACRTVLLGGPFDDLLTGTAGGERLRGRSGDDVLRGLGGRDCLFGGAGDDRLEGGDGGDLLKGGSGDDRLTGGPGRDRLHAGGGENRLSGGSGGDYFDSVNGTRDRVNCGPGRDRGRADRIDRLRSCERVRRLGRRDRAGS